MSLPIVWTNTARDEYSKLLQYVEAEFGLNAALKLMDKVDGILDVIEEHPNGFPLSEIDKRIRKATVTKQTSIIYRVSEIDILILYFKDNRRNPD